MPKQPPIQQQPPVMKMLVKYGKLGPARFASHRDFARVLERALLRAEIPMAYSSGFNPHQRVSYVNHAPTSAESVAEYVILALKSVSEPGDVKTALDAQMPPGMPILEVSALDRDISFEASLWNIDLEGGESTDKNDLVKQALSAFDAAEEILVTREGKNGPRALYVKSAIQWIGAVSHSSLRVVIKHTEPLVRPEDVVLALRGLVLDLDEGFPPRTSRQAQGSVTELLGVVQGR